MTYPMIHLNGTSAEELSQKFEDARLALDAAYRAVLATAPHARDYYPMGNEALNQANREWVQRLERIESVTQELSMLSEYCHSRIK